MTVQAQKRGGGIDPNIPKLRRKKWVGGCSSIVAFGSIIHYPAFRLQIPRKPTLNIRIVDRFSKMSTSCFLNTNLLPLHKVPMSVTERLPFH